MSSETFYKIYSGSLDVIRGTAYSGDSALVREGEC